MKYALPLVLSAAIASSMLAYSPGDTDCSTAQGPDVIVGDLYDVDDYNSVGDIAAFSVGTYSCNIGDETLFWYAPWPEQDSDGVRVASWPRDRLGYFHSYFTSRTMDLGLPHFVSAPIDLEGKPARVLLNVDNLDEHSQVSVEVLDEQFLPIPGYGRESCLAPTSGGFRQPVKWQAHEVVENVDGPIRVRVNFGGLRPEDTKIYAVYVEVFS